LTYINFVICKIYVEETDDKLVKAHTEPTIQQQADPHPDLLNCCNSLSTEKVQNHLSPVGRRLLSSLAHVKVHEGFSGP